MSVNEEITYREMYGIDENTPDEVVSKLLEYTFKTELIYVVDKEGLLEIYNSKDKYLQFLELVSILIKQEPDFLFFLLDAVDDILYVIDYGRRQYSIDNDYIVLGNELIYYLNIIKTNSTEELRDNYRKGQAESRVCKFKTDQEMLKSIAYDSIAIALLNMNETDTIDENLFLASTCYMLHDFKELYQSDDSYIDRTSDIIKGIRKKSNILTKIKVKSIERTLTNFNKK